MMVFAFLATARALSLRPAFSASRRGLAKRSGGRRAATVEQASPEAVEDEDRYRGTVLLPETSFGQRANAINKEPELQKFWADTKVYERLWADAPGAAFTLHDGPPYANGDLHIGHALNKVLKDFINRYRSLRGDKVRYVPGWDCHGLPIELKVLQAINAENKKIKKKTGATPPPLTPLELRRRAAGFAEETVAAQRDSFRRYGVWADWDAPYLTLQPAYEAAQLRVFATMFEQGHIYRGLKPVWYSPSSRTALAEAELEYPDGHTSPSVYAALDVLEPSAGLAAVAGGEHAKLAVWTTTPWTLPANLAVAVNGDLDYAVVDSPKGALVVAVDLVDALAAKFDCELTVRGSLKGEALAGTTYARPVANGALGARPAAVVVGGDYITSEGGTGLVHTAPGHGMDDYQTGLKHDLPPFSPVDAAGKFTADAGDGLEGLPVLGAGGEEVAARLEAAGNLLLAEPYEHRYPYDWRTKKPVLMRATDQWFASVSSFRQDALDAIDAVKWTPPVGRNRIAAMTEQRGDWCISRQRSWGVPLPVFYSKATGEPLVTPETLEHVEALVAEKGSDAWFELDVADLLPPGELRDAADDYVKGTDTMDVWFDSGTSWAGVVEQRAELGKGGGAPADLYLEGSDQHRGWFQSSLLTSVACRGAAGGGNKGAPYKAVLTHGFVLDEKGFKMSKSLGNVVDPRVVIEGGKNAKVDPPYGADVLRLWVASVDYTADVRLGKNALKQVFEQYRKLRNTLRYMAGNVNGAPTRGTDAFAAYDARDAGTYASLPDLDKWLLGRLGALERECFDAYENYQFSRAVGAISAFAVNELSALYLDVAKDRMYVSPAKAGRRVTCMATLVACLDVLPRLLAPLLPHLAEELFQALPYAAGDAYSAERGSVFDLRGDPWDGTNLAPYPAHEEATFAAVRSFRDDANRALEAARRDKALGASLDATVYAAPPADPALKAAFEAALGPLAAAGKIAPHAADAPDCVDDLRFLLLVSDVVFVDAPADVLAACDAAHVVAAEDSETKATVGAAPATALRCLRCWYHEDSVGDSPDHPTLCARCDDAVKCCEPALQVQLPDFK